MATKKKGSKKKAAKKISKKVEKKTDKKATKKASEFGVDASNAKAAVSRDDGAKRSKAAHRKALERSRNYAASGLAAQVTETLIDEIRALEKPWHLTSEATQAVVIARLSDGVAHAMERAVSVLAAQGHKAVICNLAAVTFREGVRAIITVAPGSEMRHELADYATKDCVIVLADPSVFFQGLEEVKPDADQQQLI